MDQKYWCRFLNLHTYIIHSEDNKIDSKGNVIGKVITSRCSYCGKIQSTTIYTEAGYESRRY